MPGEFEEAQLRAEIEHKVRSEIMTDEVRAAELDRARRALWLSKMGLMLLTAVVGIPLVGVAFGLAVLVFRLIARV